MSETGKKLLIIVIIEHFPMCLNVVFQIFRYIINREHSQFRKEMEKLLNHTGCLCLNTSCNFEETKYAFDPSHN